MKTAPKLSGNQLRFLRALAHPLKPVVQIGQAGLTEPVLKAIDEALEYHELIKVKVAPDEERSKSDLLPEIERVTRAVVAQIIGHNLVLYRARKTDPKIVLPKVRQKKAEP